MYRATSEERIREALKKAYAERAEINRRIDDLAERLKAISPEKCPSYPKAKEATMTIQLALIYIALLLLAEHIPGAW